MNNGSRIWEPFSLNYIAGFYIAFPRPFMTSNVIWEVMHIVPVLLKCLGYQFSRVIVLMSSC